MRVVTAIFFLVLNVAQKLLCIEYIFPNSMFAEQLMFKHNFLISDSPKFANMVFFAGPHIISHINSEAFNSDEEELKTI